MATFPNIFPLPVTAGVQYAVNVPLTSREADIYNQVAIHPIPIFYTQAIEAIVQFSAQGVQSNTAYVIMQTDMGDGVWIDVAGVVWKGTSGSATFSISGGSTGANALQQTRSGAPAANFSNQFPLGQRVRFIGAATTGGGSSSSSSSSSGTVAQVLVTVTYKELGLR